MQYHLSGFRSGDPSIAWSRPDAETVCDEVDVLIVGCGPAGLTLATQLAAFPEITTMLTDLNLDCLRSGRRMDWRVDPWRCLSLLDLLQKFSKRPIG